jgi:hypothetical protein
VVDSSFVCFAIVSDRSSAFASVVVHRCAAQSTITHSSGSTASSATSTATSGVHPIHGESGEGNQQYRERAAANSKQNPAKSPDD